MSAPSSPLATRWDAVRCRWQRSAPVRVVRSRLHRLEVLWLRHQLAALDRREQVYRAHITNELDYSDSLRIELAQFLSETTGRRMQLRARLSALWRA